MSAFFTQVITPIVTNVTKQGGPVIHIFSVFSVFRFFFSIFSNEKEQPRFVKT